jgi:hypothetical protein
MVGVATGTAIFSGRVCPPRNLTAATAIDIAEDADGMMIEADTKGGAAPLSLTSETGVKPDQLDRCGRLGRS